MSKDPKDKRKDEETESQREKREREEREGIPLFPFRDFPHLEEDEGVDPDEPWDRE